MADPTSPRRVDAIVAFDDLLVDRWHRTRCVLCQAAQPGHYVLWMKVETGFVAMFPLCQSCHRRPDTPVQLAYAMQRRLHPEEAVAPGAWTAWDETAQPSHRRNLRQTPHTAAGLLPEAAVVLPQTSPSTVTLTKSTPRKLPYLALSDPRRIRARVPPAAEALQWTGRRVAGAARARADPSRF